jgi:hypothetical protein
VPVRINPQTWEQEVERYRKNAPPRVAAERERRGLERDGLDISGLERCSGQGDDDTSLEGLVGLRADQVIGRESRIAESVRR